MGIFGAMTTAVAGLQAQSYALENISGNIANSQTTAFKRVDTSFADIVMSVGQAASRQTSGSVMAMSRPTNTLQGPVQASSVDTHMAINGDGYFQVQEKIGETDGTAQFSGANVFTRRGDFVMDREGYLVNGSGYYLMGIPIDPSTGNRAGDVAQMLQLSTGFLQARASTVIDYNANLPATPRVENIDPTNYTVNPTLGPALPAQPAVLTGSANFNTIDLSADPDNQFSFTVNGTPITLTQADDTSGDLMIDINEAVASINTQLAAASLPMTVAANGSKLEFTSTGTGSTENITVANIAVSGTGVIATAPDLGFGTGGTASGVDAVSAGTGTVVASDFSTFRQQSLEGGSTTLYDSQGNAVNVQFRWGKTNNSPETWNLFYQADPNATGSQVAWQNAGQDFVFNASGKLVSPSTTSITLPNMTIDGRNLGDIEFKFSGNGLTQYASAQGDVATTLLDQDGYASGSLIGVGVGDSGRITASYTNGQQIDVAEVPLFQFNGDNALKRLDGGAFAATRESGTALMMTNGQITGQALEGSNTDIAEEFSKMIVTQQAYSANSKIITTADSMMQDILNIVR
jgi:flagellar hook protein FlgE